MHMGEGRCTYRGRWIPRSYLYDYGEEPIFIGHYRPRRLGDAFGCLLVLSLLLSLVYFSGFGSLIPRHDAAFYPAFVLAWAAFFGWERLSRKLPLLAAFIGILLALLGIAAFCSLYGFIFYKLWVQ